MEAGGSLRVPGVVRRGQKGALAASENYVRKSHSMPERKKKNGVKTVPLQQLSNLCVLLL